MSKWKLSNTDYTESAAISYIKTIKDLLVGVPSFYLAAYDAGMPINVAGLLGNPALPIMNEIIGFVGNSALGTSISLALFTKYFVIKNGSVGKIVFGNDESSCKLGASILQQLQLSQETLLRALLFPDVRAIQSIDLSKLLISFISSENVIEIYSHGTGFVVRVTNEMNFLTEPVKTIQVILNKFDSAELVFDTNVTLISDSIKLYEKIRGIKISQIG